MLPLVEYQFTAEDAPATGIEAERGLSNPFSGEPARQTSALTVLSLAGYGELVRAGPRGSPPFNVPVALRLQPWIGPTEG